MFPEAGATRARYAPSKWNSLIVSRLYWVTALWKTGGEVKVYTRHQEPAQASKRHNQITSRYSPLRRDSQQVMQVMQQTGDDWDVYYERGRKPK